MSRATGWQERRLRWCFAVLILVVPATVGQHVLLQWRQPAPKLR